jgi:hypothetical protein
MLLNIISFSSQNDSEENICNLDYKIYFNFVIIKMLKINNFGKTFSQNYSTAYSNALLIKKPFFTNRHLSLCVYFQKSQK